jgi:FKBP-type peptidyl-prolyl cis-trans isomerase
MHFVARVLATLAIFHTVAGLAQEPTTDEAAQAALPEEVDELVINDMKTGDGEVVVAGQTAVVHYTGWLYDPAAPEGKGRKFDSSRDRGAPFRFPLGDGQVIRGWDEGVAGMQVGGERRLLIPPELGYGERGAGGVIPPGATLVFDVELVDVE